jgi:hypothetical protein
MAAAAFYDRAKLEREAMIRRIQELEMTVCVKDNHIEALKLEVSAGANRYDVLQGAYNDKVHDCADLEAILAGTQGNLEDLAARLGRFEFQRVKRNKRNGSKRSDPVPDAPGSTDPLAEFASVLARQPGRGEVLGQQPPSE